MHDADKLSIALKTAAMAKLRAEIVRQNGPEMLADDLSHRIAADVDDTGSLVVSATDRSGRAVGIADLVNEIKAEMPGAFRRRAPSTRREPEPPTARTVKLEKWLADMGKSCADERFELLRALAAGEIEILEEKNAG